MLEGILHTKDESKKKKRQPKEDKVLNCRRIKDK
jgi:hypothetical protein